MKATLTPIPREIDLLSLAKATRNALIVSSRMVDGQPVIVSRYGERVAGRAAE